MSRIRLLLLSMFAVLAVSAIASASASANAKCEGTTTIVLCIELAGELQELEGEEAFTSKLEPETESLLETEGLAHIVCTAAADTGTFLSPAALAGTLTVDNLVITFTGCTILEPVGANCEIKEGTIKTAAIKGEALEPTTGNYEFDFQPETAGSTVFAEITIKSKAGKTCLIAKTAKVTGTQSCKLVAPEENAVVHLIECLESGSSLLFAEKTSTFKLIEEVELSGANKGVKYDVRLG